MLDTVLVMGTGSWGTAAAGLVSENARRVVMWAHSPEVAESINEQHTNPRHLRDYVLPATIAATSDAAEAVRGADAIVIAVPSNHLPELARRLDAAAPEWSAHRVLPQPKKQPCPLKRLLHT